MLGDVQSKAYKRPIETEQLKNIIKLNADFLVGDRT